MSQYPVCEILPRLSPYELDGVVWVDTGNDDYYWLSKPGKCFVSGKETNYLDLYFEAYLHPDHYVQTWNDYWTKLMS